MLVDQHADRDAAFEQVGDPHRRVKRGRHQDAHHHADGGGLAGAVGSEEPDDLAVVHVEIDTVDGPQVAEALLEDRGPGDHRRDHVGLLRGLRVGLRATDRDERLAHRAHHLADERLRLTVADDGGGISEEAQRRLFQPGRSSKPGGTGLGLAVVKKIMDEHGGRVDLSNRVIDGQVVGAQVSLSFPVVEQQHSLL